MADYPSDASAARALRSEIGGRLARLRLTRNVTQQALARDAGIALRTLRRLETGQPCAMDSFLRIAVALGLGDDIADAVPSGDIRPIERVDARGSERRRARPAKDRARVATWSWGEESRD